MSFIDTYCFLVFSWLFNQVYTTILMHDVLVSVKKMLLSTVVNALILKYVKTAIEDHELFVAVVNP